VRPTRRRNPFKVGEHGARTDSADYARSVQISVVGPLLLCTPKDTAGVNGVDKPSHIERRRRSCWINFTFKKRPRRCALTLTG
jgi:hypothetical protein